MSPLRLTLIEQRTLLAICRLDPAAAIPDWALKSPFFSLTRTPDELSLVVDEEEVPEHVACERGWRAIKVEGPLDFALTGILISICAPLAEAGVSVFALSTYDTDYVMVREGQWEMALSVLQSHHIVQVRDRNKVGTG